MLLVNSAGTVVDDSVMRAANPFVSFAVNLTSADVAPYGYSILQLTTPPALLPFYTVTEGAPTDSNGVWSQTWVQTPISLADAQAAQAALLNSSCASAIISGFTSSALGALYTYPSQMTDQQNLTACVVASMYAGLPTGWTTAFWCVDSTAKWAWVPHTAAQIQQVGEDGKAAVMGFQEQNATLQAQVTAATTVDAVAAIVWTNPAST